MERKYIAYAKKAVMVNKHAAVKSIPDYSECVVFATPRKGT